MKLTELIFPPKCLLCGKVTHGEYLCNDCIEKYKTICDKPCNICGRPQADCRCHHIAGVDTEIHVFEFDEGISRKLIYSLKHKNSRRLREFLAIECKRALISAITNIGGFSECVLTYVPRSRESIDEYGFDHAKELCKIISRLTEIPMQTLFVHGKSSQKQKELTAQERRDNAESAYSGAKNVKAPYKVIIVDDVTTTGSTISSCAKIAKALGAEYIASLTVAFTPKKEHKRGDII